MADLELVRTLAEASDFLAVLAVARPDGSVHSSLVKAGVLDDPETGVPSLGVVVAGDALKLGHLRAAGRASATFVSGFRWVSVEGPVHLIGPDDPPAAAGTDTARTVRDVFESAGGTHGNWQEFDEVMASERRCAVLIAPSSVLTNRPA